MGERNDRAREFVWKYSTHKGGARLVLLAIADLLEESDTIEVGTGILADYTGMELRQLGRILDKIEESGELRIVRGRGRGCWHTITFTYKTGHNVVIESDKIGQNVVLSDAENTTLCTETASDAGQDVALSGTKAGQNVLDSVPTKDINNLINKKQKPSVSPGLTGEEKTRYHRFVSELESRIALPSNMAAQGKAIKALMKGSDLGKWTDDECVQLLQEQLDDGNRTYAVSWLTVEKQMGTWAYKRRHPQKGRGGNGGDKHGSGKKPSLNDRARQYDDYYGTGGAEARAG